jgi:nucleotide-binding universal stress UspA family protein
MTPAPRSFASRGITWSMHGPGQEVVCAILSGEPSKRAVRVAAQLADRLALRLALIEVHVPIPPPRTAPVEGPQPLVALASEADVLAAEQVPVVQGPAEWQRGVRVPRDARHDAITAAPAMALERLAQDPRTELLVVGDEGGGPLRAKLEGNAGREALRDVACPLVLVPARAADAGQEADMGTLVCGVDDDDAAPGVAAGAAGLARRLNARLHIVHVLERPPTAPPGAHAPSLRSGEARAGAGQVMTRCRAALPAQIRAEFVTAKGDAAKRLGAAARAVGAGLIAVGRPRHGAIGSALLGSAVHGLLANGTTPVCVISERVRKTDAV